MAMTGGVIWALGAGVLSGLINAWAPFGGLGTLILGFLSMVPLFAVGLGLGVSSVGLAVAAGSVTVALVGIGGLTSGAIYAMVFGAPVVMLTRQALLNRSGPDGTEWYPTGLLLCWLAGIAGILALAMWFWVATGPRAVAVEAELAALFRDVGRASDGQAAEAARGVLRWLPGSGAAGWSLILMTNAALAQGLLQRFGRAIRPSPAMAGIQVPQVVGLAFAVCAGLSVVAGAAGDMGRTLAIVLSVPLLVQGLAVAHAFAARTAAPGPLLAGLYIVLALVWWLAAPIVVVIGFLDLWLNFRARFAPGGGSKGT